MQLQHRMLQHTTPALPPRLYVHAPLSERGRYVTGSRHVCRMNDSGDPATHDVMSDGLGGGHETGVKRRRPVFDTEDVAPNETYRGIIITASVCCTENGEYCVYFAHMLQKVAFTLCTRS